MGHRRVATPSPFDSISPTRTLRLGTRTSKLALWQTNHIAAEIQAHFPHLRCELVHLVTQGDKRLDRPLPEIGGKGLFTAELETALHSGEIDIAVHSLKDLPVEHIPGLILGAIPPREDTRDVLIAAPGMTLATLPAGAVVGTSSLRRQAQLLAQRPDLVVRPIRGNVDTRLRKVHDHDYDAAIMAGAGLRRLGLTDAVVEWLSLATMLPAPGQGALAVQCRADDAAVLAVLAVLHDPITAGAVHAERQLLLELGGGCSAPVGALAAWEPARHTYILTARVGATDGSRIFEAQAEGRDPAALAQRVASLLRLQGVEAVLPRLAAPPALTGKRVVITRAADQADDLRELLDAAGAEVIDAPAIQIMPHADQGALRVALQNLSTYDWVLFTSANAVEVVWATAATVTTPPSWDVPQIAAVGEATARALAAHGLTVHAMPAHYLGSELVPVLGGLAGKRVLLPRSAQGRGEIVVALQQSGADVDDIPIYTLYPVALQESTIAQLSQGVDVVTFASGSAVRAFAAAVAAAPSLAALWTQVKVACIGPATAAVAHELGLPVHITAQEHTVPGLVRALCQFVDQMPSPPDA